MIVEIIQLAQILKYSHITGGNVEEKLDELIANKKLPAEHKSAGKKILTSLKDDLL